MEQTKKEQRCYICGLIKDIREYDIKRKEEPFATVELKIKVVTEIWKNGHFSGQATYKSKPMNYCPECGRKIKRSEKRWKI